MAVCLHVCAALAPRRTVPPAPHPYRLVQSTWDLYCRLRDKLQDKTDMAAVLDPAVQVDYEKVSCARVGCATACRHPPPLPGATGAACHTRQPSALPPRHLSGCRHPCAPPSHLCPSQCFFAGGRAAEDHVGRVLPHLAALWGAADGHGGGGHGGGPPPPGGGAAAGADGPSAGAGAVQVRLGQPLEGLVPAKRQGWLAASPRELPCVRARLQAAACWRWL